MDFNDNKPIYLQLADQIMDEVERQDIGAETRLMSVREYAAQTGVNPNTVLRTYTWLQDNGIIYNKRGIGYFFEDDARSQVISMRREIFFKKEMPIFIGRMKSLGIELKTFEETYKKSSENEN